MCDRHCPGRKLAAKEEQLSSLFYTTDGAIEAVYETAYEPDLVFQRPGCFSTFFVYKYFEDPVGSSDTFFGTGEPCHYVVLVVKRDYNMVDWYIATAYPSYHIAYRAN